MGFSGIYLFFLFLLQNIDCGYWLEPPRLAKAVLTSPTIYVLSKNIKNFLMKFSIFMIEKNLCISHGQVFVMHFLFVFRKQHSMCSCLTQRRADNVHCQSRGQWFSVDTRWRSCTPLSGTTALLQYTIPARCAPTRTGGIYAE